MSYSDNEPTVAAMERIIKQRDDIQSRLSAAEEELRLRLASWDSVVAQLKRAEAVVEAAKPYAGKDYFLHDAIRRYEEEKN